MTFFQILFDYQISFSLLIKKQPKKQSIYDWFYEIFKNDNVQGLKSKFRKVVIDPLFFGQKNYKELLFISKLKEIW